MAQSRRFIRPRSTKRKSSWGLGPSTIGSAMTASGSLVGTTGASPIAEGLTLVRLRGHGYLYLTVASGVNDGFHGAMGIGIVTAKAFTAGIASMPTPVTDLDWDGWLWHQFFCVQSPSAIGANAAIDTDLLIPGPSHYRFEIDSKAMRKFPTDMTLFWALQTTLIGTATVTVLVQTRGLYKLA